MIPLLVLAVAFVYAFFRPRGATMLTALISAFWFEWELPFGGRLGVFEVLFFGGLCGLLAGNSGLHLRLRIPCAKMVIAFIALSALSSILVHDRDLFKLLWGAFKPAMFAASFFLFYLTLDDLASLDKVIRLFLISAIACALIGLVQVVTGRPLGILFTGTYKESLNIGWDLSGYDGAMRGFSSLRHPTVFGTFMILPLSIVGSLVWSIPELPRRKIPVLSVFVLALALLASFARAAWVGMCLSAFVLVAALKIYQHRRFWPVVLSAAVVLLAATSSGIIPTRFLSRLETLKDAINDGAMLPRYVRWSYFFDRSLHRPLLGHGIVEDQEAVDELQYATSPHNTLIFLAVQRGWIATAVMTGLLLTMMRTARRAARAAPQRYLKGISIGVFAGMLGTYAIAGMFTTLWEDFQSSVVFWLFLAISIRCLEFAKEQQLAQELAYVPADDPTLDTATGADPIRSSC